MPEKHFKQSRFAYSARGSSTKNKDRIQKLKKKTKKTADSRNIKINKACCQHNANGDFKDLSWRAASDEVLCDKAFDIGENPKYDGYHCGLASVVYKFFDKQFATHTGTEIIIQILRTNN